MNALVYENLNDDEKIKLQKILQAFCAFFTQKLKTKSTNKPVIKFSDLFD